MPTKKNRVMLSFNDKELQKLEKLASKNGQTKSRYVVNLMNQKGRPWVKFKETDIEKILQCLNCLSDIDNQVRGIATNINQYQHTINQFKAAGKTAEAAKMAAFQPPQWVEVPKIHKQLVETIKELTKYVSC